MPKLRELVKTFALAISGNTEDPIWYSKIQNDILKYACSRIKLSEPISRQCSFSIVGGTLTGIYRFETGF